MYNKKNMDKYSNLKNNKKYNISIEEKNTKAHIRLGTKLIIYFVIAGIAGALFSNILIKIRYAGIISKYEDEILNNDMIITDYKKVMETVEPSIVTINNSEGMLSKPQNNNENWTGVIIDEKGTILTTCEAIGDSKETFVRINSDEEIILKANVILKNTEIDLAMIKIEYDGELTPIKLASVESISIGQQIVILGNNGYEQGVSSVSPGIVTSRYHGTGSDNTKISLMQVSAPINKGNTGGPICNSKGELVGLASASLTQKNNEDRIYQGIELSELKLIVNSTEAFKVTLGVREGGILTDKDKEFKGFYVQEVVKDGNAYKAGIKPTDIILEIDDNKIINIEELAIIIENKKSGDVIHCKVLSDGEIKEVDIKINK